MMTTRLTLTLALATAVACPSGVLAAHPGGLNAKGCHNNRKTGEYHCHGGASESASSAPSGSAKRKRTGLNRAFANCTEARAAGAAPVMADDPGYARHLDRDGDGIGCE
nr:excalibur calcium-binding domain-containing protein [uncultured Sphingomonas sp.]